MDYISFGLRVRELRRQKNLTQAQLAEKTGVSTSYIGHIERGTRVLSMDTFVQLCIALDADPNMLLCFKGSDLRFTEPLSEHHRELLFRLMHYGAQLVKEA